MIHLRPSKLPAFEESATFPEESAFTVTELTFGPWLRLRRRRLDLTQQELADCAGCSVVTIRKFEADERHPSKQLAELLAGCLRIPAADLEAFIAFSRTVDAVALPEAFSGQLVAAPLPIPPAFAPAAPAPDRLPLPPLPAPLTSLLGRRQDIAFLCNVLLQPDVRLLTLTGPGGTGKTRLALAVADRLAREHPVHVPDGVHFVDLSAVFDPALLPAVLAQSLGMKESGDAPPRQLLAARLAPLNMLIVLDNFEQVVVAAPELPALLRAAPGLRLLITSRVVLRLYGEHEFPVLPLPLPPADDPDLPAFANLAGLLDYPAIALFVERARAARPGFTLNAENAASVTAICRRLDGLPLAIELVAAHSKLYPPAALLAQLPSALDLDARRQVAVDRQRTLRQTIDWSYRLLAPDLRRLFARLGLFAGEFSLQAAQQVAGRPSSDAEFGEQMLTLVDHSLLQPVDATDDEGAPRFRLLFTLRDFALEKLAEQGELQAGRQGYADYYLGLAEEAAGHLEGPQQGTWLRRLEATHDNLRAVLAWSLESPGQIALGLRVAVALGNFWKVHGHLSEGRMWLERLLAAGEVTPEGLRADAYVVAARLAQAQGVLAQVDDWLGTALALYRQMDSAAGREGEATVLNLLGATSWRREQYAQAAGYYEQALAIRRALGAGPAGIAPLLYNLGLVAQHQGQFERAQAFYRQTLEQDAAAGDQWAVSLSLNALGTTARELGAYGEARAYLEQSLAIKRELGDRSGIAMVLSNLGNVDVGDGRLQEAQAAFTESLSLAQTTDSRVTVVMAHFGLSMVGVRSWDSPALTWRHLSTALAMCREQGLNRVLVWLLDVAAQFLAERGRPVEAARLLGHAERLRELHPLAPRSPLMRPFYERALALAGEGLGEAGLRRTWDEGRALSPEEAFDLALRAGEEAVANETP